MNIALCVADMHVGGIATFVLNLGQVLRGKGHDITVVAQTRGEWWPRLAERGIRSRWLPQKSWVNLASHAKHLASYIDGEMFDVLVVNIGITNHAPQLCLHYLPDSIPVALVLHNDRPEVYNLAAVNSSAWNCAVAVSRKVQQIAAARFPHKQILLIPHGIELPAITTQQNLRHQYVSGALGDDRGTPTLISGRPDKPPLDQGAALARNRLSWELPLRLLFVGRINDRQKGVFRLPAIVGACRRQNLPVRLTVIGDGPDRAHLTQLFVEHGVADWIEICGFQPNSKVGEMMRNHHLLLMPSNYEGLGIVIQEAQANGCVPVASRLPGVTDMTVAEGIDGVLVEPTNVTGFVDAIASLMTAERWQSYSQAAINRAQQQYGIQTMADRYLSLFEDLQQGGHPLPTPRSVLRTRRASPFVWRDYLPRHFARAYTKLFGPFSRVP